MKCSYGCENEGIYILKNGKYCCKNYFTKCPNIRNKNSQGQLGKKVSDETRKKQSIAHINRYTDELRNKYSKRMIEKYKNPLEREKQKEISKQIWKSETNKKKHKEGIYLYFRKNSKISINLIKVKYPTFFKVEKLRYKPNTKKIQVKCKKCNLWFTPDSRQIYDRINQLEHPEGNDGSYLYCSELCKHQCPLYNLKGDPNNSNKKVYTTSEYQTFRKFVLERDNYKCQYCEEKATDVHHERPQKLEPFFALDPDFAWSCCEKCHYEKGHIGECSTYNISTKNCVVV